MKNKNILIFAIILSLTALVISQSLLPKKSSVWKIPGCYADDIDEKTYQTWVTDNYGKNMTTTDISWNPNVSMYYFDLLYSNGTKFKSYWFTAQGNASNTEVQERAEEVVNIYMIKRYKATLSKDPIGGLDFS